MRIPTICQHLMHLWPPVMHPAFLLYTLTDSALSITHYYLSNNLSCCDKKKYLSCWAPNVSFLKVWSSWPLAFILYLSTTAKNCHINFTGRMELTRNVSTKLLLVEVLQIISISHKTVELAHSSQIRPFLRCHFMESRNTTNWSH